MTAIVITIAAKRKTQQSKSRHLEVAIVTGLVQFNLEFSWAQLIRSLNSSTG